MCKAVNHILTVILLLTAQLLSAASAYEKPDFAFPKQVEAASLGNLEKALATSDSPLTIQSIINYGLALGAVDSDSLPELFKRIELVKAKTDNPATIALINLLSAKIYSQIYNNSKWVYDSRQLPADANADYNLWSGKQFKAKITELIDASLSDKKILQSTPLDFYKEILECDSHTFEFYPTLYDFIAVRAIDLLEKFGNDGYLFSINWLCRYDVYTTLKFSYASPIAQKILRLYSELLQFHANDIAPLIITDINRIYFVASFLSDTAEGQRTKATLLTELYQKYKTSKYAAEILIEMDEMSESERPKLLYSATKAQLAAFPDYFRNNCLKNIINRLSQQEISLKFRNKVVPGDTLDINVENKNAKKYKISVYSIPFSRQNLTSYKFNRNSKEIKLITAIEREVDESVPFKLSSVEKVHIDKTGLYIIIAETADKKPDTKTIYNIVHCTNVDVSTATFGDKRMAFVTNPQSGKPITDPVKLSLIKWNNDTIATLTTDKEAMAMLPETGNSIYANYNGDQYAAPTNIGNARKISREKSYTLHGFTDLAIYRLGDTVQWGAVAQSTCMGNMRVEPGIKIYATLFDANNLKVDTISAITDDFGRVNGRFTLPKTGLTGNYYIKLEFSDTLSTHNNGTMTFFMVSDYKLPTYKVEITDVARNIPDEGGVTLHGSVITYSGFPLAGSKVVAELSVTQRVPRMWWRTSSKTSFYTTEVTTDASGNFTIEFPAELLQNSPVINGVYSVKTTVTSATGENQSTSVSFTTGKPYILNAELPENIDASKPVKVALSLTTVTGEAKSAEICYKVFDSEKRQVAFGIFDSMPPILDLSKVASGRYNIVFHTADTQLADSVSIDNVILYRPSDARSPVDSPLWVPTESYITDSSHKVSILYGVSAATAYIHYSVCSNYEILKQGWIKTKAGIHKFDYKLPDMVDNVNITLFTTDNYTTEQSTISVATPESLRSIEMTVESFRDKIVPDENERWDISVRDNSGQGKQSAIVLDMYSKALDCLAPYHIGLQPYKGSITRYNYRSPGNSVYRENCYSNISALECTELTIPMFNTWGRDFVNRRIVNLAMRNSGSTKLYAMKKEMSLADSAVEAVAESTDSENDTGASEVKAEDGNFEYRAAENPLAFFHPMLTTDADGKITFSFTAPNANTTWQLYALAFTTDLLVTTLGKEIISNKPVMVQPNLPRFLRTGDSAELKVNVMNNSDTDSEINTTVEYFNPATGDVIDTYTYNNIVAAGSSAIVNSILHVAATDTYMIGYRVKSSNGKYADGEQSIIPVLPSSEPVIETKPFYMGAKQTEYSAEMPAMPTDAKVTLQFCDSPTWYVVTALPGLRASVANDALSSAAAIYSATIAEGLLKSCPEIADAIKMWSMSDRSDSTLVSMLERNSDLKNILLSSTPWINSAKTDTERMQRLALLFDKEVIESTYSRAIGNLSSLERNNGGWAWVSGMTQPSSRVTENILEMVGSLKQLGFLPNNSELTAMTTRAVNYLDRVASEKIKHDAKATDIYYVLTRDYFPEIKVSSEASALINNTITLISGNWKNYGVAMKGISAIIMNNHGNTAKARTILSSLREYAVTSPDKGMWWPSLDDYTAMSMSKIAATSLVLDAFAAIEPSSPDIDLIRQWLILQKEAKDWGTSVTTSQAITSILLTGSKWTKAVTPATITLNGRSIAHDSAEQLTGYFRTDISSMLPSGATLVIKKSGDTPAWGATICQYVDEMENIKASSCEALAIEKNMFRRVNTPQGVTWANVDTIAVGDVIQINLSITTTRDMDYVAIIDNRGACFEPVEQLPTPIFAENLCFFRENRDTSTNLFITHLPKGVYRLSYEMYVNNSGTYSSGIASIQSQYAPALTAHSSGTKLIVVN